jgi:hypothetical protein
MNDAVVLIKTQGNKKVCSSGKSLGSTDKEYEKTGKIKLILLITMSRIISATW